MDRQGLLCTPIVRLRSFLAAQSKGAADKEDRNECIQRWEQNDADDGTIVGIILFPALNTLITVLFVRRTLGLRG